MPVDDRSQKLCVIGAGSSGLAAVKNLRQLNIPCDCLERNDDLGGNWNFGKRGSSIYASTHLISSKRMTEYTDFPMPREWPEYPSQTQALEYLRAYARRFQLLESIEFNTPVERIEPAKHGDPTNGGWLVTLGDGRERRYRGVVIANGHNWDPKWPNYPGSFAGTSLHSCEYKTPGVLEGKRVLVIGGGNSGCDIAVESAQHAAATFHSLRRGYHYLPKFVFGRPIDQAHERYLRWRVPLTLRRMLSKVVSLAVLGKPERFGLPRPDHQLFETHPIINSQMLYYAAHGRLRAKPDVAELLGERVRFVDGTEEAIDVIVYATGFNITIPFIEREQLNWRDGRPDLYLNVFHPTRDDLFVIGLIQPDSGQWGLVDYQSQLMARFLHAAKHTPASAARFRQRKAREHVDLGDGIHYLRSTRHLLEVEHFSYRKRLQKEIKEMQ